MSRIVPSAKPTTPRAENTKNCHRLGSSKNAVSSLLIGDHGHQTAPLVFCRSDGPPQQPLRGRPRVDQADPRQSFRAYLQGNQGLARRSTCWPFRIRLHAQAWLVAQPHRGLFLQARSLSVLRYIRVESKQELKDRIMAAMDEFNRYPVVHTSSDKLDQAA
jgi:hypothetical protein